MYQLKKEKRNSRAVVFVLSLLFFSSSAYTPSFAAKSAKSQSAIAIATFVRGQAYYERAGKVSKVRVKTIFNKDDKIFTKKGKINIQVGRAAVVRLSNYSILYLKNIYEVGDINKIHLLLQQGRLYSKIVRPLKKGEYYKISTPTAVAAVRGTKFLVSEKTGDAAKKRHDDKKIASGIYVTDGVVILQRAGSSNEMSINAKEQVLTGTNELKKQIIDKYVAKKMEILEKLKVMKEKNYLMLKAQHEKNQQVIDSIKNKNRDLLEKIKN